MLYYHGTTKECADKIMKNGFDISDRIWNDSEDDYAYFYKDEIDGNAHEGFYRSIESAQLTAAASKYSGQDLSVLILSTDEVLEDDSSGYGTMSYEACQINANELNENIKNGTMRLYKMDCPEAYEPGLRFFYFGGVDTAKFVSEFSRTEKNAYEIIKKNDCCGVWEDLMDVIYEYDIKDFLEKNIKEELESAA